MAAKFGGLKDRKNSQSITCFREIVRLTIISLFMELFLDRYVPYPPFTQVNVKRISDHCNNNRFIAVKSLTLE